MLLGVQLLAGIVLAPASAFFSIYLKEIGYSAVLISAIVTVQRVMGLGASLAGGTLVDTIGAKRTLVAGQLFFFAGTLLFLARELPWIALIWAVSGIGMGPSSLGATGYLIEKADRTRLGLLTALLGWGFTLGSAIGSPIAGVLLARTGWRGLVPLTALPAAAVVLATAIVLPRSAHHDPRARLEARMPLARALLGANPAVRLLFLMRFLPTVGYGMLLVFVPLLLKEAGASTTVIALYATTYSVCASLAQLAAGRIADRSGWRVPTVASYLALAASSLVVAIFPGRLWTVFLGGTSAVAAAWALSTLVPTQLTQAVGVDGRGRALGTVHLAWNFAMIVAGLAGGVLFEAWGGLPFLVGALAAAGGLPVTARFGRVIAAGRAGPPGISESLRPDPAARGEA
jgi:PPP family 3-phenylpropionic acid transporter